MTGMCTSRYTIWANRIIITGFLKIIEFIKNQQIESFINLQDKINRQEEF